MTTTCMVCDDEFAQDFGEAFWSDSENGLIGVCKQCRTDAALKAAGLMEVEQ